MRKRQLALVTVFSFTALVSLIMATGSFTAYAYSNRVMPRVLIAGEKIGGEGIAEASMQIQQRIASLREAPILLNLDGKLTTVTLKELGITPSVTKTVQEKLKSHSSFDWLKFNYWKEFFSPVEGGLAYSINKTTLRQKLEHKFNIRTIARNATLRAVDGRLQVIDGRDGRTLDVTQLNAGIDNLLRTGSALPIALDFVKVTPDVSVSDAKEAKAKIEKTLLPIYLKFEQQNFSITPQDQYGMLDFKVKGEKLRWSASTSSISSYLYSNVAISLNISMRQRTILAAKNNKVTDKGSEGREVQLAALAEEVARTITEHTDTKNSPIQIATRTIPVTDYIITPGYIAGLWKGLYLDINLTQQRIYILDGKNLLASYLISSGKPGTPTPIGQFKIVNKASLAESSLFPGIWMQMWNGLARLDSGLVEGYGIHRIPCFNASCTLKEDASHLGTPVSHGCIRVQDDGADWIFAHASVGTKVNIHI